jgi:hypothetical protein
MSMMMMFRHPFRSTTRAGIAIGAGKVPASVCWCSTDTNTNTNDRSVTHHSSSSSKTHRHRRRLRQRVHFSTHTNTNSNINTITTNNNSSKTHASGRDADSAALEPSPVLAAAWPHLQERFASLLNADGHFPLLTNAQTEHFAAVQAKAKANNNNKNDKYKEREAAVLMILASVNGQPGIIYTKRADHMVLHGGEISFPGGHFDAAASDASLLDTALREAHEELLPQPCPTSTSNNTQLSSSSHSLLQPPHLTVLGQTSCIPSLNGTPVTPFLAVLWPDLTTISSDSDDDDDDDESSAENGTVHVHRLEEYFPGDPQEVASVFFVSLADLLQAETSHMLPRNRFGVTLAPCFPVADQGTLWGLTAYITRPVLHQLLQPIFMNATTTSTTE